MVSSRLSRVETKVSPTSPSHWTVPEIPGATKNGKVQQDQGISRSQLTVPVFSHHCFPCLWIWRKTTRGKHRGSSGQAPFPGSAIKGGLGQVRLLMGVGKSPTANPEDAPALWDVRPCSPARKECSCLPVPHSCRLCHAQGDIHMHLARQILELPPCQYSRPSRQAQTSHSVRAGDLVSCSIPAFFSHQTSPRCPPSQSRCLVSVL